ncbi:MAG: hypothetical protein JXB49_18235 [Bacteroidales bacterium]|nr:hypothetical protein [Bacteroidales bacterium]
MMYQLGVEIEVELLVFSFINNELKILFIQDDKDKSVNNFPTQELSLKESFDEIQSVKRFIDKLKIEEVSYLFKLKQSVKHKPSEKLELKLTYLVFARKIDSKHHTILNKYIWSIYTSTFLSNNQRSLIEHAIKHVKEKSVTFPVWFHLLPEKFTIAQYRKVIENIFDLQLDSRNFQKKILQAKYIIPLNEKQKRVKHKPARFYFFSCDVYTKTHKTKVII